MFDAMDRQSELKAHAAAAALEHVRSGQIVGLGSGSTATLFIQQLADKLSRGELTDIRGVPTSRESETIARDAGIPIVGLDSASHCDLVVDGADEVDPELDLIKGLGGALLREKIVAQNSRRRIIIVDQSKLVDKLGTKGPLPVEVLPFASERLPDFFKALGGVPVLRERNGKPYVTDNGNLIYDLAFPGGIDDPAELEDALLERAGVIETGLFLNIADEVIIATGDHIETKSR